MLISVEGTCKIQLKPDQESMGDAPLLSHHSLLRNPWPKLTGVLERVGKEKPTVGSPFAEALSSDRVPQEVMDVNVYLFTHSNNSCK